MHFGGKKQMYGVADYLANGANGNNALINNALINNSKSQIGDAVTLLNGEKVTFVPANPNANNNKVLPNATANNESANNANTTNQSGNSTATPPELPNADQQMLAMAELDYLRSKLGENNFGVLSGDDERVVAVFTSPGEVGAKAELQQINNAGTLIDTFALLDVLINDADADLSEERLAMLEKLREATRQRLTEVLGTAPGPATPSQPENAWSCVKKLKTNEIAIVGLAVALAIALVSIILVFLFRRRCPKNVR